VPIKPSQVVTRNIWPMSTELDAGTATTTAMRPCVHSFRHRSRV